jgi:hypothetical protein
MGFKRKTNNREGRRKESSHANLRDIYMYMERALAVGSRIHLKPNCHHGFLRHGIAPIPGHIAETAVNKMLRDIKANKK